jgi:hypothetical protein
MNKAEAAKLAATLLADVEADRLPIELPVTKALTLAKAFPDDEAIEWLSYEIAGYDVGTPVGKNYAILTCRWDGTSDRGFFGSASSLANSVATMSQSLEVHKQLQPSGQHAIPQQFEKAKQVHSWATAMAPLEKVISNIKAQLHLFASRTLVKAQFSETSKSVFDRYQSVVDKELASKAAGAFQKLPYVFERLQNGEAEAVSHALTSCRRIIDSFSDAIFPARNEPVLIDGQELDCGASKTKNRIRAFMATRITSGSRRDRINKNLGALYDRVSAGVHAEVTVDEAQALVLNTYLLLGELASLP